MITREQAWELLCEFTKTEGLRKHALAVETCVAAYARKLGEDEHKWSITALLHDFDWEIHPTLEGHPQDGEPILAARGIDEEIRRAILSHANHLGVKRGIAARKDALRVRRTGRLHHRDIVCEAASQRFRSGCSVGEEEDER